MRAGGISYNDHTAYSISNILNDELEIHNSNQYLYHTNTHDNSLGKPKHYEQTQFLFYTISQYTIVTYVCVCVCVCVCKGHMIARGLVHYD